MRASMLLGALFVVCAAITRADAGRLLLENQRCPAGCDVDGNGCVADATAGGYRCTKCLGKLVVNAADGTCGCPPGRYADMANDCSDCPKGSWCAGGTYADAFSPNMTDCGASLTTIGKRATSIKSCVNVAGTSYSVDASGNPSATTCPADTYGPGLRKQRACVPCPPGYTTNTLTGQSRASSCLVPEGAYNKGPGQVAPCPRGTYKAGFQPVNDCTPCPRGTTTVREASTSLAACSVVLPGLYPAAMSGTAVTATERCPQKFYCAGGIPTVAFDPSNPAALNGTTVAACADGTWTQGIGASTATQCMTPPGYKTANGATTACADGEYRAEWKVAAQATSCNSCGSGISSFPSDVVFTYAITAAATRATVEIRASAEGCYIKPGQGMYYLPASKTFRAVNCVTSNYGVLNDTLGLGANPCRECSAGLMTNASITPQYYAMAGGVGGFTSPKACVAMPGYGYNGREAVRCAVGSWNPPGGDTCTQCEPGTTTVDDPNRQVAASDCVIDKGFGFHDAAIVPCPIGTYNDALRNDSVTPCTACPVGQTTSQAGSVSVTGCDLCVAGYGGTGSGMACSSLCGGASGANYGPAGRDAGSTCEACPEATVGFLFDHGGDMNMFVPSLVARTGADTAAACLAEFAQFGDTAWYLGGNATLVPVPAAGNFSACVADCKADAACQYVTYDYDAAAGSGCSKKVLGSNSSDTVIGYKAAMGGDTSAMKLPRQGLRAKLLASGSYTFWHDDSAAAVGTEVTLSSATTVQACVGACDADDACVAVLMTGITPTSTITSSVGSCSLVKGDSSIATFKRSMTKAVTTRLSLASVW